MSSEVGSAVIWPLIGVKTLRLSLKECLGSGKVETAIGLPPLDFEFSTFKNFRVFESVLAVR